MRIVTSQTRDARIVCVVTAAIEHAIRLETNVVYPRLPRQEHRLLKTRVTRTAKRLRKLVTAKPAEALLQVADACDASLIVVGTSGESPIKGAIVGSTPHRLLQLSTRPVLCVPPAKG